MVTLSVVPTVIEIGSVEVDPDPVEVLEVSVVSVAPAQPASRTTLVPSATAEVKNLFVAVDLMSKIRLLI